MNTFGSNFRVEIFGESHGPAIGVVVDGVKAGISLSKDDFIISHAPQHFVSSAITGTIHERSCCFRPSESRALAQTGTLANVFQSHSKKGRCAALICMWLARVERGGWALASLFAVNDQTRGVFTAESAICATNAFPFDNC